MSKVMTALLQIACFVWPKALLQVLFNLVESANGGKHLFHVIW